MVIYTNISKYCAILTSFTFKIDVGVEFKPTTRSTPLGCDAAMKIKVGRKSKKRESF